MNAQVMFDIMFFLNRQQFVVIFDSMYSMCYRTVPNVSTGNSPRIQPTPVLDISDSEDGHFHVLMFYVNLWFSKPALCSCKCCYMFAYNFII